MLAGPKGTHSILEAPASTLQLHIGQRLAIRTADNSHLSPPVLFSD